MDNIINKLIVYRQINENSILMKMSKIFKEYNSDEYKKDNLISMIYEQINKLLDISTKYGFNNDLWHNYIAYIIATQENPFTLISEKKGIGQGSVNEFVRNDYEIFMKLFNYDFDKIEKDLNIICFTTIKNYNAIVKEEQLYNKDVSIKVQELSTNLEKTCSIEDVFDVISSFYEKYGVGDFGLNRAFKIDYDNPLKLLTPITSLDDVVLDDLVGYEIQKNKLIENTEAFVNGYEANNVLLYGDAGTGKSTSIKAILNQYYDDGLRMIEVYKHDAKYLSDIISLIKNRNYRFILYMDDLSFEESESEYKYLKALIEGGLETKPDNVLIYATSNRRHLIKETWNERSNISSGDEMYKSDTVREKLSLVDRFGVTIGYYKPSMKDYFVIVKTLAKNYPEIDLDEDELTSAANKWIMTHGGPSGRTAQQLILHLRGICAKNS